MIIAHPDVVTAQHSSRLSPIRFDHNNRIDYDELVEEFLGYANILLGRDVSPVQSPYLELMEVATAYHSRGREVEMIILTEEQTGKVPKGSDLYRFRTGQLASFIEMARKCIDLGSRRLTQEQILTRMRDE